VAYTALTASVLALLVAAPADADFPTGPGLSSVLTASSSGVTTGIQFLNGPTMHVQYCATASSCTEVDPRDLMWAPDGSRAVFDDNLTRIATVRADDPNSVQYISDTPQFFNDEEPTYRSDGSIVWARYGGPNCSALMLSTGIPGSEFAITPSDGACYGFPNGGPDGKVVFDRTTSATGSEVWIWDGAGLGPAHFSKITTGQTPAISPDGSKVAYANGGALWVSGIDGSNPTLLYDPAISSAAAPVWSPDGATIAFYYLGDVLTVPAAGGTPASTPLTGLPAYRTEQKDAVVRLAGASRFTTSTAVSQSYWATAGATEDSRHPAHAVVLSRSDTFADALGGSALAAAKQGPLLLTPPTELDPDTSAEISRILGGDHTAVVYILGGTGAISDAVKTQIQTLGYATKRLSGASRYETAIAIANEIDTTPDLILAATGADFPDALAAGAAAGSYDVPGTGTSAVVVLTDNTVLPAATKTYLNARVSADVPVVAIGGQAAAATAGYGDNQVALIGSDRFETAEFVAEAFFGGNAYAGIATGTNWPDALAGGALLGTLNGPLLLTAGTAPALNDATAWHLSLTAPAVSTALIFGGTGVVAESQATQAGDLISGPAGYVTNAANGFARTPPRLRALLGGVRGSGRTTH